MAVSSHRLGQTPNPREKALKLGAHTASIFGFDQDYGMSVGSHLTAAAVELASMESALLQQYR